MSRSMPEEPDQGPDDERGAERSDVDPPYPHHFPASVHRFRRLLAELIARRILAERRRPPDAGEAKKA
jgi:hypothetical protein